MFDNSDSRSENPAVYMDKENLDFAKMLLEKEKEFDLMKSSEFKIANILGEDPGLNERCGNVENTPESKIPFEHDEMNAQVSEQAPETLISNQPRRMELEMQQMSSPEVKIRDSPESQADNGGTISLDGESEIEIIRGSQNLTSFSLDESFRPEVTLCKHHQK